jgi:hypothetical protein
MKDNDHYPYHDWEQKHKLLTLHEPSVWQRYRWMIIATISILLALFFASTTTYLFFKRPSGITTLTPTPIASSPNDHTPPIQGPVMTPVPPLSTTVITPSGMQTIPMNHTLTCTTGCEPAHVTITTATINSNTDQFMLNVTVDPGTGQGNYYFQNLDIQDENGTTYQPQGQVRDGSRFDLVPHQPIVLVATYPFIPQSGLLYTLKTTLQREAVEAPELFGDYQFSFKR